MKWGQLFATVAVVALLALLAREAATRSIDFPVYHRAGRHLLAGEYQLYSPETYAGHPGPSQEFRYLWAVAVLFVPFAVLPLPAAALAFFLLKLGALWWVGTIVAQYAGATDWGRRAFLIAFTLVGGYLVEELRFGNAHFFCVTLMVVAWDRAERGEVWVPAMATAVAIATKLIPIALLAYLAIRHRARLCVATIACFTLLVVLPAAVIGPAANARELRAFTTFALEKVGERDNYSLRGMLVRYLSADTTDVTHNAANLADLPMRVIDGLWLCGLLVLGVAAFAAVWRDDPDPVTRLLELSIVMTGILIASPHTQRRYYVALYVPAVALCALLPRAQTPRERRAILVGIAAMAVPGTILPLVFAGHRLALLYEASSPYCVGALVLFGVLVSLTRSRKAAHRLSALGPVT